MTTSRRNLIQALAAGGASIATAQGATKAFAQVIPSVPPVNVPGASAEERELKIVNIELLEGAQNPGARPLRLYGPCR